MFKSVRTIRLLKWSLSIVSLLLVIIMVGLIAVWKQLPSLDDLTLSELQSPLRIYTSDKKLIGVFGEIRRDTVPLEKMPITLTSAVISAEDDEFFQHSGVDFKGIFRAIFYVLKDQRFSQGGSTITMQLARNYYLSNEKSLSRKLKEILLSWKIENRLNKNQILELYLNKIYLGNRAYGFSAAAQVYYGKSLDNLDLPQYAMLASLPKGPSILNPIINPKRSLSRRNYVLKRMNELGYIDDNTYKTAKTIEENARLHGLRIDLNAPYVAEAARQEVEQRLGNKAYQNGYIVFTTIDSKLQRTANQAVANTLYDYDQRHGYRGPLAHIDVEKIDSIELQTTHVSDFSKVSNLIPGLVVEVGDEKALVLMQNQQTLELDSQSIAWTKSASETEASLDDVLLVGDIIYVREHQGKYYLSQVPQVEGSLVSIDSGNGAIRALVGGFSFSRNHYNHVTQARRQPGSSFKPFIYSAALEKGYTAASIVNDAPIVKSSGSDTYWRPENDGSQFLGPIRLRYALTKSRNMVAIRILEQIGMAYATDYVGRFGFNKSKLPSDLTMALGSGEVSQLEIARAYAVFANSGYLIDPHLISRIENQQGEIIYNHQVTLACNPCTNLDSNAKIAPRVITEENAYIMTHMMQDVIQYGTAQRANILNRSDIAGKTGTTNDQYDAWFAGFHPNLVAVSWVGFDNPKSLGKGEYGGKTALPMWIDFMSVALPDLPVRQLTAPKNIAHVRIDKNSGEPTCGDIQNTMFEVFRKAYIPENCVTHDDDDDQMVF